MQQITDLRAICSSDSNMSKDRNVSSSVFDSRMSNGVGPARLMADVMPHVGWLLPPSSAPPPLHITDPNAWVFQTSKSLNHFRCIIIIIIRNPVIYTVSTKKLYPCISCHNSGKQRRILTKFYDSTEMLNCKQVTKFQQNRSTSATATASFVRSLKSISVHYRHWRD